MTLLALAWELTLFELAYEYQGRHPGFLMIDSPQKNLAPESRGDSTDEFMGISAGAIVNGIYRHIIDWLFQDGAGAQIIIVDNVPPALAVRHVIREFSGNPSNPPYGLIDDATNI
ncbi:hypothetical protein Aple_009340 [Acrocarpospora pleiomorpha]|uniref:Uncharacterized protein n=2 Tax=Acrocarpospora pleiomorpha TaxID=90975 RepID=A0A5M3XCX6_9ACTN|nr:hypothetical protein Aple_009340 [Acrocarpospora pleiomorpha]